MTNFYKCTNFVVSSFCALSISTAAAQFDPANVEMESEGVKNYFSVPDVSYDTPAFAEGKADFTSHQEMMDYLYALQQSNANFQIRIAGKSQEDRDIPLLIFSKENFAQSAYLLKSNKPTVFIIGLQHGNEPAAGESTLVIAQRLSSGDLNHLLDKINVLIVPRANPDGAEAFDRVSADGTDLNRDHLLLNTPEVRTLANIARFFQPDVVIDSHEFSVMGRWVDKFGVVQKHDAMFQYATNANVPEALTDAAENWFRLPLMDVVEENDISVDWYYTTSSQDMTDLRVSMGGIKPNVGRNINGLRGNLSFLIEVRGIGLGKAHFKRRVRASELMIGTLLEQTYEHADEVSALTSKVAEEVAASACEGEFVVDAAQANEKRDLHFLDAETGEPKTVNVDWRSSLNIEPKATRARPCGYLLDASQTLAVERLRNLGVTVHKLVNETEINAEKYLVTNTEEGQRQDVRGAIEDANTVLKLQVETEAESVTAPAGSFYVSLAQRSANLITAALEPDEENSYVANRLLELESGTGLLRVTEAPDVSMVLVD